MTVGPATNMIYWAEFSEIPGPPCATIRGADLADVPGTAETLVAGEAGPSGVALGPAAGKIYWTNQSPAGTPPGSVRRANLDRSSPETVVDNQANPIGVAINAGKIYWTNLGPCCSGPGAIRVADLANVSGTTTTLFSGELGPAGVAIDPTASPSPQIYWGTFGGGTVRAGNLDGSGGASTLISGESFANFPVLLRAPTGTEPPAISSGVGGGAHMQPGELGARPARRRSCLERRPPSPISGRGMGRTSPPVRRSRLPSPATTPAP